MKEASSLPKTKKIITIAGWSGVGKGALCRAIQNKLGWKAYSTGGLLREMGAERGLTINEIDELARHDPSFDRAIDNRAKELGEKEENFVIDGRIAWYFIPHSFKILMTCNEEVRLARIAHRDGVSIEKARELTKHRETAHTERYKTHYGIENYLDPKNFDLVIDTTSMNIEEELNLALEKLKA